MSSTSFSCHDGLRVAFVCRPIHGCFQLKGTTLSIGLRFQEMGAGRHLLLERPNFPSFKAT
ncbi:hypothetical protein T4B_1616 [Trichinella pseudospiralis]|uniref:Uncharacterized protein n=2 Tax=Trichinella pseudospiralis TaxID=6337 RepID=A0A0V0XRX4_TRIPS|nr:hypothetical protein T4E_9550 [Trichinella pseudospiralis]KRY67214.1 hypothetical protein T4A_5301 [Trichinella pseudospiralis]KRY83058.1 hypothetical protein T4D_9669 [Trichinella pseudospiralis]KRZ22636.1 hypothetical protein T4B_1616 [Trichinella pseudospiralis]KRZ35730.1 hypothetical protein T4C_8969 [Trichinella pseudospiralis]